MLARVRRRRRQLRFPGTLAYLITHPDDVEQVLVKNNRNFIKDNTPARS